MCLKCTTGYGGVNYLAILLGVLHHELVMTTAAAAIVCVIDLRSWRLEIDRHTSGQRRQ